MRACGRAAGEGGACVVLTCGSVYACAFVPKPPQPTSAPRLTCLLQHRIHIRWQGLAQVGLKQQPERVDRVDGRAAPALHHVVQPLVGGQLGLALLVGLAEPERVLLGGGDAGDRRGRGRGRVPSVDETVTEERPPHESDGGAQQLARHHDAKGEHNLLQRVGPQPLALQVDVADSHADDDCGPAGHACAWGRDADTVVHSAEQEQQCDAHDADGVHPGIHLKTSTIPEAVGVAQRKETRRSALGCGHEGSMGRTMRHPPTGVQHGTEDVGGCGDESTGRPPRGQLRDGPRHALVRLDAHARKAEHADVWDDEGRNQLHVWAAAHRHQADADGGQAHVTVGRVEAREGGNGVEQLHLPVLEDEREGQHAHRTAVALGVPEIPLHKVIRVHLLWTVVITGGYRPGVPLRIRNLLAALLRWLLWAFCCHTRQRCLIFLRAPFRHTRQRCLIFLRAPFRHTRQRCLIFLRAHFRHSRERCFGVVEVWLGLGGDMGIRHRGQLRRCFAERDRLPEEERAEMRSGHLARKQRNPDEHGGLVGERKPDAAGDDQPVDIGHAGQVKVDRHRHGEQGEYPYDDLIRRLAQPNVLDAHMEGNTRKRTRAAPGAA
eukprot:scaffold11320_cov121-Isochrysis_galbana.AAC.2